MTGAELPIVAAPTGTKPVRIFLNDPAAQARWADDVAWLKGGRDVDGWFVHTDGSDIHICSCVPNGAGMDDMAALGLPRDACPVGVFRGAIAFLENNSTILFAGLDPEIGTVYDESPDFTVRWGEGRARPSTCCRGWFGGNDTGDKAPIDLSGPLMWIARTGGNARLPHRLSGHAFGVGEMIEYVPDEDPYRVWDGTRRIPLGYYNGQICLGATDVVERCIASGIASAKGYLADDYPLVTIGFFNEDNWQVCVCENCTRPIVGDDGVTLRSGCHSGPHSMADGEQVYRSTQYMQFVNRLADGVAAKYPGVKTEILAYLFQRPTPKCRISDNVAWMYCPYKFRWCYEAPVYHPSSHHVYDNIVAMQAKGGEMHVYDYHAFAYIDTRALIAEASAEDYRWYTERGGRLLGAEFDPDMCSAARPGAMLNAWLFNRVGWDADLRKVEQLRKFYLRRLYREGAPAVEAYFARRRCGATHRPMPGIPDDAPEYEGLAARKLFRPYRNKIANPMARRYFEILEKAAVGKDQDGRVDVSDADWFRTAAAVNAEFWDESAGLYRAASVRCREHDVFGTAYAVWLGVAAGARADRIAAVFRDRYGDFVANGQVRHLPKGVYWEACAESAARDAYQNGGYWGMATGWFAWALARVDPALAGETLDDFRQTCERNGSPEWTFGDRVECPEYLATLALPYQCLRRLEAAGFRRNGQGKEEGR